MNTTFDDGVLKVYEVKNVAEQGDMPKKMLVYKDDHYYGFDTLGITRYYEALRAGHQIDSVINIPNWENNVNVLDIVILEDGLQYQINMLQKQFDSIGLKITKLTLERTDEDYEISY